ncbi:hypothetical protein XENORESO_013697 [Xenotaenia resolanae]|uniref:Uncharacterized protein n=1 Tax=Xenotaenia resolanae TaxID=208358 RepID=A0ABV0VLZ9_9TELE
MTLNISSHAGGMLFFREDREAGQSSNQDNLRKKTVRGCKRLETVVKVRLPTGQEKRFEGLRCNVDGLNSTILKPNSILNFSIILFTLSVFFCSCAMLLVH